MTFFPCIPHSSPTTYAVFLDYEMRLQGISEFIYHPYVCFSRSISDLPKAVIFGDSWYDVHHHNHHSRHFYYPILTHLMSRSSL